MTEAFMTVDDGGGRERKVKVDYPSNSKKIRELKAAESSEKPAVQKVVTGEVTQRKPNLVSKIFGKTVAEDSGSVIEYLLIEVLVPAAKNLIYDLVTQGAERKLYGDSKPRSSRQGYTSYGSRYVSRTGGGSSGPPINSARQVKAQHDFSEIILQNRGDAEDVLEGLRVLIDQYNVASVSDFYELIGITADFTDNKWGWTDLRTASVRTVRGGYVISLPRTQPLT